MTIEQRSMSKNRETQDLALERGYYYRRNVIRSLSIQNRPDTVVVVVVATTQILLLLLKKFDVSKPTFFPKEDNFLISRLSFVQHHA